MGVGTTPAEGRLFWKKWPNVVETSELDRQNCKNLWNVAKKITFLVGLGKIFGRSVKNFGRPGQFLKVWKKIRNVREKISEKMYGKKSRGSKILATRGGEISWNSILPPPNACCPSNALPPQIPRPGAATDYTRLDICSLAVSWKKLASGLWIKILDNRLPVIVLGIILYSAKNETVSSDLKHGRVLCCFFIELLNSIIELSSVFNNTYFTQTSFWDSIFYGFRHGNEYCYLWFAPSLRLLIFF